ncbi:MAG TPA: hypothetical protein VJ875_15595 [Pyrinomonadaceae bacterium]|nr:hypothetical protein [Pyrinomonadaceae bacterium]
MSDAIVAVGGTGKRAALLYLKLVNTWKPVNLASPGGNIFVVDMEPQPGTPDALLNDQLQSAGVPTSHFVSPVPSSARVDRTITLRRFMGFGEARDGDSSQVAHTLYNNQQLSVQIIKGMNCEPTVGATVASRRFVVSNPEAEVQYLEDRLASFDRTIVVGSIIGGTGAGVIPRLVYWLHKRLPAKLVYGLLFLQWIEIPEGDVDEPNDVKMAGNTKAWLNYLIEHHPEKEYGEGDTLFQHYVLIGKPERMPLNQAGSDSHHPLHLLGALYLLQFDTFLQLAPGATGPHYLELSTGITPGSIQMGDDTMEKAVIREKLFAAILAELKEQQPDEALSPFTLFAPTTLAWKPFISTLEKIAAKWNRRRHLDEDWKKIAGFFDAERKVSEDRVEELKALTATMPGARDVFDFDWTMISQHADANLADARRLVKRNLTEAPVAFPGHEQALSGVAAHFINQLRSTLRQMSIK